MLFVACYALLRLQVPRHPPCALSNLTTQNESFLLPLSPLTTLHSAQQGRKKLDEIGFSFTLCSFQGARPSSSFALSASKPVADANRYKYLHGASVRMDSYQPLNRGGFIPTRIKWVRSAPFLTFLARCQLDLGLWRFVRSAAKRNLTPLPNPMQVPTRKIQRKFRLAWRTLELR